MANNEPTYLEYTYREYNTLQIKRDKLKEAAEHCLKIFMSMADRGRYPEEVLPHSEYYLGKQGLEFLTDALKD